MSNVLIELKGLTKNFDDQQVLKGIDLNIHENEFLTLLGPSGCGKTTTLRIIAGFDEPSSGEVLFDGVDISKIPPYKREVNTVFQKYALFPFLNVYDNVAFGLKIKKMDKSLIEHKVKKTLKLVGLEGFDKRDVKRLTLAAVYCGKTLESHMFYHEAQVDPLTGLKNRRGFYEYYSDRIRPKLEHLPVSVIMCDIDFFKRVNDTYGHNAGDAVLVNVSDILKQGIRGNGEVVRWGGEEFVLLLPERELEQARDLAEELRNTVEAFTTHYEDQMIAVTMSFGVRRLNPGMSADENVERVDAKLYEAKKAGRNRVCM